MKLDFESNTSTFAPVGGDFSERVESDNNSAEVSKMLREGIEAAQNGKTSEARSLLLRATEAAPNNEKAWLWLASISEYPEELLVFLNNVLRINPENERALEWAKATKSLLSKTFVQRGIEASKDQTDFAKQCFLQAIVHDNENEMAWLWLASVSASEEEKSSHLQRVLSINPENETAKSLVEAMQKKKREMIFDKAVSFAAEGDNEQALIAIDEYLQQEENSEKAWLLKAFLVQTFDAKMECFDRVLENDSTNDLARLSSEFLRSIVEKPETEEVETETVMPEPEAVSIDLQSAEFVPSFFEEAVSETVESEEFSQPEEVFEIVENQFADENIEESALPELETQQYSVSNEEEFSLADELDSEIPEFAPQEEISQEFNEESSVYFEETTTEPEEIETPETSQYQTELEETGYAFYETEEKADDSLASQDDVVAESDKNIEDFHQIAAQPEFNPEELLNEFQEENPAEEYVMENYSPDSESPQIENQIPDVYEFENSEAVAENNFTHVFETPKTADNSELQTEENISIETEAPTYFDDENNFQPPVEMVECLFCDAKNEVQSIVCHSCRGVLILSDLEMILDNQEADKEMIGNAVYQLEHEREDRELDIDEIKLLALGHFNLGNLPKGLSYLIEAAKLNPDDIVLSSQVNALKIRLSEIEKQKDHQEAMPKNLTIFVVDDSATVRKLIAGKLEKSGHEVVCAVDGIDALHKMSEVIPDLVLLDINMPRMDGYQVCKMIRANDSTKDVPVVMISGKDGFFDKVRGRMAGTTGYITKPFGPETLMKTVETYIV